MLPRNWSPDVVELGDAIAALSITQAGLLSQYLAEVYGIEAPSTPLGELLVTPDQIVEPTAPPLDEFDVVLEGFDPPRKIVLIKVLREQFGLGIKEAKDLAEAAPRKLRERLPRADAEKLKAALEAAGAKVAVVRCQQ
jgi:large subunit ribosomal protein L7/L12